MNRTQDFNMMKTLKYISALLVLACTLLSSCSLLVASSIYPSADYLSYDNEEDDEEDEIYCEYIDDVSRSNDVYGEVIYIPVDGGSYEFKCRFDQFYISKIFDSSLPCNFDQFSTQVFRPVNAWVYNGPFYTITCDTRQHTWKIEVEPLISMSNIRQIWVMMWPGFNNQNFVFQFEQGDYDNWY